MKLFYSEEGSGYPVIFLHGFPFDHQLWDLLLPYLSEDFRFIFPDLRGFGESLSEKSGYLMSEMAEDVIQLMDGMGIQIAILIGHSMGGYLALEITRQQQTRIAGLGLIASHIYSDTREGVANRLEMIEKLESMPILEVLSEMPEKLSTYPSVQDYCRKVIENANVAGIQGALYAMAYRPSSEFLWAESIIPKLVIAGRDDQFIPIKTSETVANSSGNVIYKVLENAGHMLMREKPAETAEELEKLFRQVRR